MKVAIVFANGLGVNYDIETTLDSLPAYLEHSQWVRVINEGKTEWLNTDHIRSVTPVIGTTSVVKPQGVGEGGSMHWHGPEDYHCRLMHGRDEPIGLRCNVPEHFDDS